MKKLKYICEGDFVKYKYSGSIWKVLNFSYDNRIRRLYIILDKQLQHKFDEKNFTVFKKVLTNNKLNRKLYEGKYVIREGYLTVDMDEI